MRHRRVIPGLFLAALLVATSAAAQIGRVNGIVRDEEGPALKGAIIVAEQVASGFKLTGATDDKGRFIMIGLRSGLWRFIVQAPGFAAGFSEMNIRVAATNPPLMFTLRRTSPAAFGALGGIAARDLQAELSAADALFEQQRWDDAIEAYRTVMKRSPALSMLNLQLAAAYRAKKDYDAADAAYNALLKAEPDSQRAYLGLAAVAMERGDEAAGLQMLLRAAEQPGAGRDVFFTLGDLNLSRNAVNEAARWFQKAADADPSWGKPLYKLGLCAIQSGNANDAARLMARVIAVDPISPEAGLAKSALETLK